jgi:GH15 family glucan-1,4-alpha-glucosidase
MMLSLLGDTSASRRYIDCLATYRTSTDSPLQVVYGIDGQLDLPERERHDLAGYDASRPVRFGNAACGQRQLDSLGFFIGSALVFLKRGGAWQEEHWEMVRRAAEYTVANWSQLDSGVWEMRTAAHFVSSKVMSWAALDGATKIAARLGRDEPAVRSWKATMTAIHAEVMERGWSERRGAFRQHYDADAIDASALLIPLTRFLSVDHPRVLATIDRILEKLTIDGHVHRYDPREIPNPKDYAVGEFEGAFVPCTCWLATALAMAGRTGEAETILAGIETAAGPLGLLAEEVDTQSGSFLGNFPLVFSHAEYIRAALALDGGVSDEE